MGYTFVLGGAKSGKSTYAEKLAQRLAEIHGLPVTYVATAQASDDEMVERVGRHRDRRPADWSTVEVPLHVADWLQAHASPEGAVNSKGTKWTGHQTKVQRVAVQQLGSQSSGSQCSDSQCSDSQCSDSQCSDSQSPGRRVILIDCLSLLLNNWLFIEGCDEDGVFERIDRLVQAMTESPNPIVVVSNEVGQGIVPANPLSRNYRDWLGLMNQQVAATAEKVIWVVAGIPMDLRTIQVPLP